MYNSSENETTVEVCANLVLFENITGNSFEVEFTTSPESGLGGMINATDTYCTLIVP